MRMDTSGNKTSWRDRINKLKEPFNPELEIEKEKQPSPTDVRINHPENGSNIAIKDNGTIQFFAGDDIGIKIDPNSDSIQFMGGKALFKNDYINFKTSDKGLRWNYTPFNRALANPWVEVLTTIPGGSDIIEKSLTTGSPYVSAAGPCAPGTVAAMTAANLDGESVLKGFEFERRARRFANGIKEILNVDIL